MPTEEYYEHPELVEEEIFKHKVDLLELDATDVSSGSKDKKKEEEKKKSEELEREREFNEVYPKERASKQGADSASSSPMAGSPTIVLVCSLVMAIQGRV